MPAQNVPKRFVALRLLAIAEMYPWQMADVSCGSLKRGTVYMTLQRLESGGFAASRLEEVPDDKHLLHRRFYRITDAGRELLRRYESSRS